jgi:hypothetical protein
VSDVKVTLTSTPAEQVIAAAIASASVRDERGRLIVLKRPGILAQFRIVEVAGESAKNEVYMRMILPLIFVTEIDGDPILQPANKIQLEALITRLDDPGIDAVMKGVKENWGQRDDPEGDKLAIKK